jgi:sialidase-1
MIFTKRFLKPYILLLFILITAVGCTQKVYQQNSANGLQFTATSTANPILKRNDFNPALRIVVNVPSGDAGISYENLQGIIDKGAIADISKLEVYLSKDSTGFKQGDLLGSIVPAGKKFNVPLKAALNSGSHYLWLNVILKPTADMDGEFQFTAATVKAENGKQYKIAQTQSSARPVGFALRQPKDDQITSYRIPGIVTTDKGTLISVYDIRFDTSRDLPGNIDVGMNRSTDGGKTWSPMKTIMDMGAPHENNGVGDPAILFDPVTKTIWVTALWSKGNNSIAGSGPGLTPEETGQFVVVSSKDDGLTWTAPYSITPQVKNPEWRLFFPGPGNGIAMADGKIVFAAQYWDAHKMPHSTLIYSDDHGKTWKSGVGAKSNTTESQLVETTPGTLMLNMRDNRGKFRSVATTTDMGKSWKTHATSYNTLEDPVCMASIIKAKVMVKGQLKDVLFFSNPNISKSPRKDITIKASLDLGETWQPANELLIDERECFGYSALTKIDDNTIGILYEGINSLYFVRVPVAKIIK